MIVSFKRHFFIEGGAAAQSLLDELSLHYGKDLQYIRVPRARLPEMAPIIDGIIAHLKQQRFIMEDPKYTLGSTRLAAYIMGKEVPMHAIEKPQVVQQAIQKKETYGDIDLDVELLPNKNIKEVGEYFKKLDPKTYAYQMFRDKEINMGVRINDAEVIQVDIVDVAGDRPSAEYSQFSSMKDMSLGLKGVMREVIVRSAARTADLRNRAKLDEFIANSQDVKDKLIYLGTNKRTNKQDSKVDIEGIRYSLGEEGLKVILRLRKINLKTGKVNKTPGRLNLHNIVANELSNPVNYHELDLIADILGFSNGNVLYHASEMVKEIQNFPVERKQEIWNSLMKMLQRKLPTTTAGGQITQEEANHAIEYIRPYFQGIDYNAWQEGPDEE